MIPFAKSFTGSARDPKLEEKLRDEGPGILQWAIAGCLAWQRDGLNPPSSILLATDSYREQSDPVADFLAEACDVDPMARAGASAVQSTYGKWCDLRGIPKGERLTTRALSERLAERFTRRHTKTGWSMTGCELPQTGCSKSTVTPMASLL